MIYSGVNVSTIKRTITVYRVSNGVHRERQVESVQLGKSLDFDISDMSILLGLEPFQKLAVVGGWVVVKRHFRVPLWSKPWT